MLKLVLNPPTRIYSVFNVLNVNVLGIRLKMNSSSCITVTKKHNPFIQTLKNLIKELQFFLPLQWGLMFSVDNYKNGVCPKSANFTTILSIRLTRMDILYISSMLDQSSLLWINKERKWQEVHCPIVQTNLSVNLTRAFHHQTFLSSTYRNERRFSLYSNIQWMCTGTDRWCAAPLN